MARRSLSRCARSTSAALVDLRPEHRLGLVEAPAHVHALRALAREEEGDRARWLSCVSRRCTRPGSLDSRSCDRVLAARRDDRPSMVESAPADLERVRRVRKRDVGARPRGALAAVSAARSSAVSAPSREQRAAARRGRSPPRRTGGASSSTTWAFVPPAPSELTPARRGSSCSRPGRQLRVDEEGRAREVELGIRRLEVKRGGKGPVMKRERRLDQARDACGRVEVTDVRLHRAESAVARLFGHHPERLRESGDLDGVTREQCRFRGPRRRRSCRGRCPRAACAMAIGLRLAVHARRGEADSAGSVVGHGRAFDDGVDRVAVGERVLQPLQHDDAEAVGKDRPRRPLVERAAVPVG